MTKETLQDSLAKRCERMGIGGHTIWLVELFNVLLEDAKQEWENENRL